ncbi:hypothetical protein BD779DRAFT_1675573 [Infundibulicybe gibba]|nr:hypothetical protein BD779DRAFT_1675573 [Infundibulicybe gibba]
MKSQEYDSTLGAHKGKASLKQPSSLEPLHSDTCSITPEPERFITASPRTARTLRLLAQRHGFSEDMARDVWWETGSILETDLVLAHMWEVAEQAGLQAIRELQNRDGTMSPHQENPNLLNSPIYQYSKYS